MKNIILLNWNLTSHSMKRHFFIMILVLFIIFSKVTIFADGNLSGIRIDIPYSQPLKMYDSVTASRTIGVAPLSVHFSTNFSGNPEEARAFHQYDYTWDFGDPSSGVWGTTGKSKNTAKGGIAAHVFETSGNYHVNLTVRDQNGIIDTQSFSITVQDPEVYYAGTKTTCVNPPGDMDFNGAPLGARHINTDDLSTITQYATEGSRILFKRGSSWSTDGLTWPTDVKAVTIGAYGTGVNPDSSDRYENAPEITINSGTFLSMDMKQDWRIMELSLVDSTRSNGAFGGTTEMQQILLYKLKVEGFTVPIGWSHWNSPNGMQIDQMSVVSCEALNSSSYIAYVGSERLALLGNSFKNPYDSHVIRVWQAYRGVIGHNQVSGSSLYSSSGRQALKLHGPSEAQVASSAWDHLRRRTEYTFVSDNTFGSSGPWPISLGPQDNGSDERLSNIIFERNFYCADFGDRSVGSNPLNIVLRLVGRQFTVRNNILDGSNYGTSFTGVWVCPDGIAPVSGDIWIYNNTIYKSDNAFGNERIGIDIGTNVTDVIIKNNIVSFPNANIPTTLIRNRGISTIQNTNVLNGTINFNDPDNSSPLLRSFALNSNATIVIDKGNEVASVFEDYLGRPRPNGAAYDIGAHEYN